MGSTLPRAQKRTKSPPRPKGPADFLPRPPLPGQSLPQQFTAHFRSQYHPIQQKQNGTHLAVGPPGQPLVQKQADPAGAHIAQDGRLPHVGLPQIECIAQITGQYFGKDGPKERLSPSRPCRSQGLCHLPVRRLHVFIPQPGHHAERINGQCQGPSQGPQSHQKRTEKCQDQRRHCTQQLDQQFEGNPQERAGIGPAVGQQGPQKSKEGPQDRAQHRHPDGGRQRVQDLSNIPGIRRDHGFQNVQEPAAPFCQHQQRGPGLLPGRRQE